MQLKSRDEVWYDRLGQGMLECSRIGLGSVEYSKIEQGSVEYNIMLLHNMPVP